MRKKYTPEFSWDEEIGLATCSLVDEFDRQHIGIAQCHLDDEDMKSEKIGCEIAMRRAEISCFKSYIKDELQPRLRALNQLYYSMNRSKKFNEKSYENRMLKRQIRKIEYDIQNIKKAIIEFENSLQNFIDEKDKFYQKIRQKRAKGQQ